MTRPTLVMLHGWGFDASLFDGLRRALPEFAGVVQDRGYFGPCSSPMPEEPTIAVGHSLGALLLAMAPPPGCIGLVAINGFDRFTGAGAVPPRMVARMRARFADAPETVLAEFRRRCGVEAVPAIRDRQRLADDLVVLATADAAASVPVLALHGDGDPILPEPLRRASFRSTDAITESHAEAGHLLPLTHAGWCADRIRAFAA